MQCIVDELDRILRWESSGEIVSNFHGYDDYCCLCAVIIAFDWFNDITENVLIHLLGPYVSNKTEFAFQLIDSLYDLNFPNIKDA